MKFEHGKITGSDKFVSGTEWKSTDSVKFDGINFKKGDKVYWRSRDDEAEGKNLEYSFIIDGFLLYDDVADALPTKEMVVDLDTGKRHHSGLGRIPVDELRKISEFKRSR